MPVATIDKDRYANAGEVNVKRKAFADSSVDTITQAAPMKGPPKLHLGDCVPRPPSGERGGMLRREPLLCRIGLLALGHEQTRLSLHDRGSRRLALSAIYLKQFDSWRQRGPKVNHAFSLSSQVPRLTKRPLSMNSRTRRIDGSCDGP